MSNPLCRYCGNPMRTSYIDRYEISFKCECDGYCKEQEIKGEIVDLKNELYHKENQLMEHQENSLYSKSVGKLERELRELRAKYGDEV